MEFSEKIYCSLDLETTGFDPLNNEILEIGFVFFKLQKSGFKIIEEWTQVFKPSQPAPTRVLGLTGITAEELEKAPSFASFRPLLQKKLQGAVLVGHNIIFDIRFLEAQGIVLSGSSVDTMDLVQFLLPTQHSYNLENLMYSFKSSHVNAHRALADSWAVVKLVEKLLSLFSGFPEDLKNQMRQLSRKTNAPWVNFLETAFPVRAISHEKPAKVSVVPSESAGLVNNAVYDCPWEFNQVDAAVALVERTKENVLLVVPKQYEMLELYRLGVVSAVCSPDQRFNELKFDAFLKKQELTLEEVKFALKILVWSTTNWQSDCLADLNLSFFGGQFKSFIAGNNSPYENLGRVACCDHKTFLQVSQGPVIQGRSLVVVGMQDFERAIVSTLGRKASWGYALYILRSIFDPETEAGQGQFKVSVIDALAATDLFFGLTIALFLKLRKGWGSVVIDENIGYAYEYQQVMKAAENYLAKLEQLNSLVRLNEMETFIFQLSEFFVEQGGFVKWVDISDSRCTFHSMPIDISEPVLSLIKNSSKVCFVDIAGHPAVVKYFSNRLGVGNLEHVPCVETAPIISFRQRVTALFGFNQPFSFSYISKKSGNKDLAGLITGNTLPAGVVYSSVEDASDSYAEFYKRASIDTHVFAQNTSGGLHKLFHGFVRRGKSLLLISGIGILKYLERDFNVRPVDRLIVRTLIIDGLPVPASADPYSNAVAAKYEQGSEAYYAALFVLKLQRVFWFFYSKKLKTLYIKDGAVPEKYRPYLTEMVSQMSQNLKRLQR